MVAETFPGAAPRASAAPSFATLWPPLRRFSIGLFLIAAFVATATMLLLIVTAIHFQSAIEAPEFQELKVSTGWIRRDVTYLEHYWMEKDAISRKEDAAEDEKFNIGQRGAKIRADMSHAAEETRNFIDLNDTNYILPPLKLHAFPTPAAPPTVLPSEIAQPAQQADAKQGQAQTSPASAASPNAEPDKPSDNIAPALVRYQVAMPAPSAYGFGNTVDDYFDAYYAELDKASNTDAARKSLNAFKVETYKRLEPYFRARAQFDSDSSQIRGLNVEIAALDSQNTQLDDESQQPGTALANGAYWSLTENLLIFKSLVGEAGYNIIALPRMMLVLLLAIFMGVLGSLIYITKDFHQDPDRRGFWNIAFRIGLGAGVAFALFFFAAAGMLAMEQSKAAAQSDMSPYLIAFLGITGGYLSDRVTQWMREMGENAFKTKGDGPPDRWAVGLDGALKANGLDQAMAASAAGATAAETESWVAMTKPVPGEKQMLIAAFLREHPSRIFTDIPPS